MSGQLVDNARLRRAVAAFAADPKPETVVHVLRAALAGELLLDATGSDMEVKDGRLQERARIRISSRVGPDGKRALLAFTSNDEIARMHPEGTRVQSVAQPASAVLEMAKRQGAGWLFIDPAETTAALSSADIEGALRHPRNEALQRVIAAADAGLATPADVLAALRVDAPLLLAGALEAGQVHEGKPRLRVSRRPDGTVALLAYTSAPEVAAREPRDGVIPTTTTKVLEMLRGSSTLSSLVINPAGPWVELSAEELAGS